MSPTVPSCTPIALPSRSSRLFTFAPLSSAAASTPAACEDTSVPSVLEAPPSQQELKTVSMVSAAKTAAAVCFNFIYTPHFIRATSTATGTAVSTVNHTV
ncbi:MAG: hypothetical protein J6M17_02950 [Ruminococcus sp.]|nr:hypothetical protein [Ruminococcus sp.]